VNDNPNRGGMIRWLAFPLSWILVISLIDWNINIIVTIVSVIRHASSDVLMDSIVLMALSILSFTAFLKYNVELERTEVIDFVWESILFNNVGRTKEDLRYQLDQYRVEQTHEEISGSTFPTEKKTTEAERKQELQEKLRAFAKQEIKLAKTHPLHECIHMLRKGEKTDITEKWKIHNYSHKGVHEYYPFIQSIILDPGTRTLEMDFYFPNLQIDVVRDGKNFRLWKRDLYGCLQAMHSDPFLNPLRPAFMQVIASCCIARIDDHGLPQPSLAMRVTIASEELKKRENQFFNGSELHTIAAIEYNDGNPLI
jgi:hypothetical protein